MPQFRTRIAAKDKGKTFQPGAGSLEHVTSLRSEASRIASQATNPIYRSGFESGINWALDTFIESFPRDDSSSIQTTEVGEDTGQSSPSKARAPVTHTAAGSRRKFFRQKSLVKRYRVERTSIMGTIEISSEVEETSCSFENYSSKIETERKYNTEITLVPSRWLIMFGFKLGCIMRLMHSASSGWQFSMRTLGIVRDDALVFEFSRHGNLQAVRSLCERGDASVNDTDSKGRTPLYVSMISSLMLLSAS